MENMNSQTQSYQQISEIYSRGNADKLCDYIADSILDAIMHEDSEAKVELDVMCKSNLITIVG